MVYLYIMEYTKGGIGYGDIMNMSYSEILKYSRLISKNNKKISKENEKSLKK